MENKVLVVDDETGIADAIAYAMHREGYQVETAYDGVEAINKIKIFIPDVVILDVMMPKLNGFDVLKEIEDTNGFGVIMLTAKGDIVDKILGLELGADDYMTKPFDMRELIARTRSIIRRLEKRAESEADKIMIGNHLVISQIQRSVKLDGAYLELTPKEFDLLVLMLTTPGRVYSRDQLLDLIWDIDYVGGTRTVDIHIQRLRKKLGKEYQQMIQTVHGVGYRAIRDVDEHGH